MGDTPDIDFSQASLEDKYAQRARAEREKLLLEFTAEQLKFAVNT